LSACSGQSFNKLCTESKQEKEQAASTFVVVIFHQCFLVDRQFFHSSGQIVYVVQIAGDLTHELECNSIFFNKLLFVGGIDTRNVPAQQQHAPSKSSIKDIFQIVICHIEVSPHFQIQELFEAVRGTNAPFSQKLQFHTILRT